MSLISFIKNAGKKFKDFANRNVDGYQSETNVANAEAMSPTDYQNAILSYLKDFNLRSDTIEASYNGNGKVTLRGEAETELEKARIITAVGNVEGVETIDDQITVSNSGSEVRYYDVKSGDTLSAIAKEMYGDANKYPVIFEANRPMLKDPDEIYPGQKLVIPAVE